MAYRTSEVIVTVMVRRRVVAVLDEDNHIISVEEELEDIEEMDLELEDEIGPVDEHPPDKMNQKDFIE